MPARKTPLQRREEKELLEALELSQAEAPKNNTADHAQTDASTAKDDEAEKDTAEEDGIRTPVYPLVESDAPTSTEKSKKSRAASKKEIPTSETSSLVKKDAAISETPDSAKDSTYTSVSATRSSRGRKKVEKAPPVKESVKAPVNASTRSGRSTIKKATRNDENESEKEREEEDEVVSVPRSPPAAKELSEDESDYSDVEEPEDEEDEEEDWDDSDDEHGGGKKAQKAPARPAPKTALAKSATPLKRKAKTVKDDAPMQLPTERKRTPLATKSGRSSLLSRQKKAPTAATPQTDEKPVVKSLGMRKSLGGCIPSKQG